MPDGLIDRLTRGVWRECRAADWAALVAADGDAIMAATSRDRFHAKQNRSIVRWTLRTGERPFVVYLKRHARDQLFRGWLATLFGGHQWSASSHEAQNLDWAAANGFRTPRIASVGERIGPWGGLQSYLALEELTGMIALHEAIPAAANRLSPAAFASWKRGLTAILATTIARLHRLRRFHKDLYLCHFFIPERWTHVCAAELGFRISDDRSAPARPSSVHGRMVAAQGPGAVALFFRYRRRDGPRPAALCPSLCRQAAAFTRLATHALGRRRALAKLPAS